VASVWLRCSSSPSTFLWPFDKLENDLLEFIRGQYPEIIEELRNKQELEDTLAEALDEVIKKFKVESQPEESE